MTRLTILLPQRTNTVLGLDQASADMDVFKKGLASYITELRASLAQSSISSTEDGSFRSTGKRQMPEVGSN